MKAFIIVVINGLATDIDQIIYDNSDREIVRREMNDLRRMDCGKIKAIECETWQVAERIEDMINETGCSIGKAVKTIGFSKVI